VGSLLSWPGTIWNKVIHGKIAMNRETLALLGYKKKAARENDLPDERRTDELGDHLVVDLTRIKEDRAKRRRDPSQSAHRDATVKRARKARERGTPGAGRDSGEDLTDAQQALDRDQKVLDDQQAELDRDPASLEQSPPQHQDEQELNREQTALDREQAALDRDQARLDRAQAALDRESKERQDYLIDELTGLLRRGPGLRELQQEIDRARRQGHQLLVAFIDVDGLKVVNDRRGHAAGDRLLREVAEALRHGLRSYDLVLRYGGDEFLCALSNAGIDHAERRLSEVADDLGAAPSHGSITWGLAELQATDILDDLVARADAALYTARRRRSDPRKE
jgi:diguanylate cyclase (GGDEF)-like protein